MTNKLTILIAEDDENDVMMLTRALKKAGIIEPVYFVRDGEAAVEYLNGKGAYADRAAYPSPWLAIFDLKMPKKTGFEVLEWVRKEKSLERLPILIISSSEEERDIQEAQRLGASAYMVKPLSVDALAREIRTFYKFWRPTAGRYMSANPEPPTAA